MNTIPEHVEQILSEAGDGQLTASRRAELDRIHAEYPAAADELRRFSKLAKLLNVWRALPATVNLSDARTNLIEMLAAGGQESAGLDDSLREFRKLPELDWRGFHRRVTEAVRENASAGAAPAAKRRPRWRLIAGLGTPLAAAAALLIAVLWQNPDATVTDVTPNVRASIAVQLAMPSNSGRIEFRFDQSAGSIEPASSTKELSGSAIAIGPGAQSAPEALESALLF